jgi:TRAP-type C4-dicarboxylate transport system permease small subunit
MRRALDRLYAAAFGVAAACFAAIAVLVLLQILGRLTDRALTALGAEALGLAIPSLAEIGAFLFVSAVFLGMAGTLRAGGHVRVTIATQRLPAGAGRALSGLVIAAALALGVWATWHSLGMVRDSIRFGDVSYGMIPIPLALPQGIMCLGLAVFCVALADEGWSVIRGRAPAFREAERAKENAGDMGEER